MPRGNRGHFSFIDFSITKRGRLENSQQPTIWFSP